MLRTLFAGLLFALAAVLFAWGAAIVSNIWGYRDSTVATYLLFGLPLIAFAVVLFAAAWRLASNRGRRQ